MYKMNDIDKYINGEDIPGKNIDELENDADFMYRVLFKTHDKNMYFFCSDELKINVKFVEKVVSLFRDDVEFVNKVGVKFIESTTNEADRFEFDVYVKKYLCVDDESQLNYIVFACDALTFCGLISSIFSTQYNKLSRKEQKDIHDMGFSLVVSEYGEHPLIIEYFAEYLLDNIFNAENYNFEDDIHHKVSDYTVIEKEGCVSYLLKFIYNYDNDLSDYLANNISLLDPYVTKLEHIVIDWEYYNSMIVINIIDAVIHFSLNNFDFELDYAELLLYLIENYHFDMLKEEYINCLREQADIIDSSDENYNNNNNNNNIPSEISSFHNIYMKRIKEVEPEVKEKIKPLIKHIRAILENKNVDDYTIDDNVIPFHNPKKLAKNIID